MIAIAIVAVMSTVSIEARFGEPNGSDAGFDMPVKAGVLAVDKAHHTLLPSGEVMLFIAGGSGAQLDRHLTAGPVSHVRVRELPRGLAIVLTPTAKITADDVQLIDGHLKIRAVKASPQTDKRTTTADNRQTKGDNRSATNDDRQALADTTTDERQMTADKRLPTTDDRQAIAELTKPSAKQITQPAAASSTSMRTFFTLTLLIAAAAAAIVFGKKRQMAKLGLAVDGIEVVSVKALGAKQRLAVVEVGGERLLIATSDQGLQLLSKLGDAPKPAPQPTQAQSLSDFASALEDAQQPTTLTHPKPKARRSTDVAGLIKLRAASAWTLSEGGDLT